MTAVLDKEDHQSTERVDVSALDLLATLLLGSDETSPLRVRRRRPSKRIDDRADCYSCHQANAAVDTTFVQFYPTLLPIAARRGTLSPSYVAHEASEARPPAR